MAFRWPPKDPNETLDYSVDWSRFLNGKTLGSVEWFVLDDSGVKTPVTVGQTVSGLQVVSFTNTSTVATIYLDEGTLNKEYVITCRINYDSSPQISTERNIKIRIKEQ
jgi:hypothetical protein